MRYSRVFLASVLLALIGLSGSETSAQMQSRLFVFSKKSVQGNVFITHRVFAHCIILLNIADHKSAVSVVPVYFAPEDNKPGVQNPCDAISLESRIRVEGSYERVAEVKDLGPENAAAQFTYLILNESLERGAEAPKTEDVKDFAGKSRDAKGRIRYFRAGTYKTLEVPPTSPFMLTEASLKDLRDTVKNFLDGWYVKRDAKRFWSYVPKGAPLRDYPGVFSDAFLDASVDPSTFTSWKASAGDKDLCVNDPSRDSFCIHNLSGMPDTETSWQEYLMQNGASAEDKLSIVNYAVKGHGYNSGGMTTFWIEKRPGFWGKMARKKPKWALAMLVPIRG